MGKEDIVGVWINKHNEVVEIVNSPTGGYCLIFEGRQYPFSPRYIQENNEPAIYEFRSAELLVKELSLYPLRQSFIFDGRSIVIKGKMLNGMFVKFISQPSRPSSSVSTQHC